MKFDTTSYIVKLTQLIFEVKKEVLKILEGNGWEEYL